jgi:tetratricopeptide (TPR) repeat protein
MATTALAEKLRDAAAMRAAFESAREDLTIVIGSRPGDPATWANRARANLRLAQVLAMSGGDAEASFAEAVDDYGRSLSIRRQSAAILNGRGLTRFRWARWRSRHGRPTAELYRLANADFEAAIAVDPDFLSPRVNVANICLHMARRAAGAGEDPEPWREQALAQLDAALKRKPGYLPALGVRARALGDRATAELRRGIDPRPTLAAAFETYAQVLQANPKDVQALANRTNLRLAAARVAERYGDDPVAQYEAAIADADRLLAVQPRLAVAMGNKGLALAGLGELAAAAGGDPLPYWHRAVEAFGQVLAVNRRDALGYYNRARVRLNLARRLGREQGRGELTAALEDLELGLRLNPRFPLTWRERARAWVMRFEWTGDRADLDRALADLDKAGGVSRSDWRTHRQRGDLLLRMNRAAEAVRAYEAASSLAPRNAAVQRALADARTRLAAGGR